MKTRIVIMSALWLGACTESTPSPEPPSTAATEPTRPLPANVRLLDVLDQAQLELGLPVDASLEEIAAKTLARLDFESAPPGGFRPARSWRMSSTGESKALAVTHTAGRPQATMVKIEPGALVRVERRRKGDPNAPTLKVLELTTAPRDDRPGHPADVARVVNNVPVAGTHVSLAALKRRHQFPKAEDMEWHQDTLELRAGPQTRSLLLLFDSTGPRGRTAWFDDIVVSELDPTFEQRLLMAFERLQLDPESPAAYAQFLPLPQDGVAENEENFEYRHGLVLPAPGSAAWTLKLSQPMRLTLQVGLLDESAPDAGGEYEVRVNGAAVAKGGLEREWTAVDVAIEETGEVTLELRSGGERVIPVFANPILSRPRTREDPPDVFIFAVDTLRADRLSTFGYGKDTSPALSALAEDAVVFERTYAQSNWTPESFAGLFTSRYAGQHGVTERFSVLGENTMAATLSSKGYFTQGIAYKLLLYDMGFERGFDAYFNRPRFHLDSEYEVHAGTVWGLGERWLREHEERQKFLFLHFNDPHQPFNHRGESLERFTQASELNRLGVEMPVLIRGKSVLQGEAARRCSKCSRGGELTPELIEVARTLYDGEVHYTDQHLGRFVDALESLGLYDESLVIFVSDHGELLGEHRGVIGHGVNRMFEEVLHVPLVIKPPKSAGIAAGRVSAPVRILDVLPTILELIGEEAPDNAEGRSLVPLMKGEVLDPVITVSENVGSEVLVARDERWKLTLSLDGRARWVDLEADPEEKSPQSAPPARADAAGEILATAARHIARTHGGQHLLIEGNEWPGPVTLECAATLAPYVGTVQKRRRAQKLVPSGPGPVWFAAALEGESDDCALVTGESRAGLATPSTWADAKAVEFAGLRVRTVRREAERREVKETISAQELEALEALGYMGH